MDHEKDLEYTQQLRRAFIDTLAAEGPVPRDEKQAKLFLTALKDMDATTIAHRRNNIDAEAGDTSREALGLIQKLMDIHGNANPFQRNPDGSSPAPSIPEMDAKRLGDFDPVAGEDEIAIINETSEEFSQRMADPQTLDLGEQDDNT